MESPGEKATVRGYLRGEGDDREGGGPRPTCHGAVLKTTEAFVPPNPKLLESA